MFQSISLLDCKHSEQCKWQRQFPLPSRIQTNTCRTDLLNRETTRRGKQARFQLILIITQHNIKYGLQ